MEVAVEAPTSSGADRHLARLRTLGNADEVEDALYEMIDEGFEPGAPHYNAVIDACAPAGDLERAERWLFRLKALDVEPDIGTYNAIIRVAAEARNLESATNWLEEAQLAGHAPNLESFQAMLSAVRRAGDTVAVEAWFEKMMEDGLQPDIHCCNLVIGTYADKQNNRKVAEWIAIAEQSLGLSLDAESYNLAIGGYTSVGDIAGAEGLVQQMKEGGVTPSARTYILLTGDGKHFRELPTVERWSQELREAGVEMDAEAYAAVVGAWAAAGDAQRAEEWYSWMVDEGKQTAEALAFVVDALVLSGGMEGMETAEEWVDQFREAGLAVTPAVYAALASADVFQGDFEQVEARMQQMEADGLEMDEDALSALLLAYANAQPQQSQLAEQMFKQQMLRGRMPATRGLLEALRAAVGGARCLALRRELQISTSDALAGRASGTPAGGATKVRWKSQRRQWAAFKAPAGAAKVLSWE